MLTNEGKEEHWGRDWKKPNPAVGPSLQATMDAASQCFSSRAQSRF